MAYGVLNDHVTYDVTWPSKVLWGSTVGYLSDSLASCLNLGHVVLRLRSPTLPLRQRISVLRQRDEMLLSSQLSSLATTCLLLQQQQPTTDESLSAASQGALFTTWNVHL